MLNFCIDICKIILTHNMTISTKYLNLELHIVCILHLTEDENNDASKLIKKSYKTKLT